METAKEKISISFVDIEVQPATGKVLDFGGVRVNEFLGVEQASFHSSHLSDFVSFIGNSDFICGHNLFAHDLIYLRKVLPEALFADCHFIDTLLYSPLLLTAKPYHRLLKDDKINPEDLNNPLNDSIGAKDSLPLLSHQSVLIFTHGMPSS